MRVLQLVALVTAAVLLAAGAITAYETAQQFNESRCWGCLALNPASTDFEGFWTAYPSRYGGRAGTDVPHPAWIRAALNETAVVMLFFWFTGCSSCKDLWDKMKDQGTVTGTEADGDVTVDNVTLFSIDFISGGNETRSVAYDVYTAGETAPTTVVLFETRGDIRWYAFEGATFPTGQHGDRMTVQALLEEALQGARP